MERTRQHLHVREYEPANTTQKLPETRQHPWNRRSSGASTPPTFGARGKQVQSSSFIGCRLFSPVVGSWPLRSCSLVSMGLRVVESALLEMVRAKKGRSVPERRKPSCKLTREFLKTTENLCCRYRADVAGSYWTVGMLFVGVLLAVGARAFPKLSTTPLTSQDCLNLGASVGISADRTRICHDSSSDSSGQNRRPRH